MNKTIQEMIELYKKWVKALDASIEESGSELEKATLMARKETYTMEMIPALERLLVNTIAETEETEKMKNKYRVIINLYYNNPEYFYFDNAEEAVQFLRMAAEHIGPQDEDKKTTIMLEVVSEGEAAE